MSKSNYFKRSIVSLAAVALYASFSTAYAVDAKNYTALSCVKSSTGGVLTYENASIKNTGTTPLTVECPMMRDWTTKSMLNAVVSVTDLSSTSAVMCILKSVSNPNSNPQTQTQSTQSGFFGNNPVSLSFAGMATADGASYYMTCIIPSVSNGNASKLHSYYLTEDGSW